MGKDGLDNLLHAFQRESGCRAGLYRCSLRCDVLLLMHCMVSLRRRLKTLASKMVITIGNEEEKGNPDKESKEESILAMLGIIGTILNLVVIIFVYIYTTL